jgi:hypothetical protein
VSLKQGAGILFGVLVVAVQLTIVSCLGAAYLGGR